MIVKPMAAQPTVVMIPARLRSTRLPDKPLAEIGGAPMIVQVWRRACAAGGRPRGRRLRRAGDRRGDRGAWRHQRADRSGSALGHGPDLPGARTDRSRAALCPRHQPAGRSADPGAGGDPQRARAARAARHRHGDARRGHRGSAREGRSERGQGDHRVRSGASRASAARCTSRGRPRRAATGRCTITSASMGSPVRRWSASPPCRRARSSSASGSSSCARSRLACPSAWRSLTPHPLGVDTPADLERARRELAARAV